MNDDEDRQTLLRAMEGLERQRDELLASEREARREAEEARLARDRFLSMISHELRTPLNAILGWVRILRAPNADPGRKQRALEVIERNAWAQAQLIEDLLDVSRLVSGKLQIDARDIDPIPPCQNALEAVRPAADAKGVLLEEDLGPQGGRIVADPDRLQQLVGHLLSNAVKFTSSGGRVRLELRRTENGIEISVVDTGRGIPPELLPRVFERFNQATPAGPESGLGLGLGLAIVKNLVELHRGTVEARSEGQGQGAEFVVRLPSVPPPAPGALPDRRSSASKRTASEKLRTALLGLRILFVDDNEDARELGSEILTRYGAKVRPCGSATEALAALEIERPDVLISDISMPAAGGDGFDLLRAVRLREDPANRIPAIALTARTRTEDRIRILSAGFQLHVPKPVDPEELVTVVATLAGRVL